MRRRSRRIAGLALAALALAGAVVALDRLFPPDLARAQRLSTVVLDRAGAPLRIYPAADGQYRLAGTAAAVDPRYLAMLIAYEDARFRMHPGVDPLAGLRAAAQWARAGRVVSGASTITMQVARLLEPRPRTLGSKLVEALRAVQLERRLSKDEILGLYLTLAPFGGNLEGIEAASLAYFGKPARELTTAQAALLVALPQAPGARRPDRAPQTARAAQLAVLARLQAAGVLDAAAVREAAEEAPVAARADFPFLAPHLADRLAAHAPADGILRTTIDGAVQRAMETAVREAARGMGEGASIAVVLAETRTRAVRAWIGGHDFFAPQGQIDLARATRSPGSTLKPFVYGLAFDDLALHPDTRIADLPHRFGDWAPRNFDRSFRGTVTVREALQQSLNLPAVAVLDRIGPARFQAALAQSGVRLRLPHRDQSAGLPVVLGGGGIRLADLVALYAGLADGGRMAPLRLQPGHDAAPGVPVLSPLAAAYLTRILAEAPRPDSVAGRAEPGGARRIAYKTGTSYGFRDAWAIGYSATHVMGVWVGRADGTPRPGHYGRNTAAPLLFKLFDMVPGNRGLAEEPLPADAVASSPNRDLPRALRRFALAGEAGGPKILFPPAGAEIEWRRSLAGTAMEPVDLEADGGTPPYRWLVNGVPVASQSPLAELAWMPAGPGFYRIVLLDARGRSAATEFRLRAAP